jgi:hypothetical protein
MINFTEMASVVPDRLVPFTDQLRRAVAAYLARFKDPSREHRSATPAPAARNAGHGPVPFAVPGERTIWPVRCDRALPGAGSAAGIPEMMWSCPVWPVIPGPSSGGAG